MDSRIEALVQRIDGLEAELARYRDDEKAKFKTVCALLKRELGDMADNALARVQQLAFRTWPLEPQARGKIVWLDNANSFFALLPWTSVMDIFLNLTTDDFARLRCVAACFALPQPNLKAAMSVCTYCYNLALAQYRISFLDEILRLRFDKTNHVAFDSVSQKTGSFRNESKEIAFVDGRYGLRMLDNCVLKLPAPVHLSAADGWTISVWFHAPLPARHWHNLVDGEGDDFIVITFRAGILGNYTMGRYADFDAGTLSPGWHHLAVVGCDDNTIYYINGEVVGKHPGVSTGDVLNVGNRGDGRMRETFTLMSDLRIFRKPALPEHVQKLAMRTQI